MPEFLALTAGLTECRCECCGLIEEDTVTHLLVAEAVLVSLAEHRAKRERDDEAWAEAESALRGVS